VSVGDALGLSLELNLIHTLPLDQGNARDEENLSGRKNRGGCGILNQAKNGSEGGDMAKRKQAKFSAAKAVKALARERVGQPKASRVIVPKLERETGGAAARGSKHKEKFEKLIEGEE
jgi:hypothetical protein